MLREFWILHLVKKKSITEKYFITFKKNLKLQRSINKIRTKSKWEGGGDYIQFN